MKKKTKKVTKRNKVCTVNKACPECKIYADICTSVANALQRGTSITFILGALEREKQRLCVFADKQEE